MRAANVGGHQTFKPAALAKDLSHLGAVNLGAAGTLVIREKISATALRKEISGRLTFKPEMFIVPGAELIELFESKPFGDHVATKQEREFLTVMEKASKKIPPLPFYQPAGQDWQVSLLEVRNRFVLSLWRHLCGNIIYPNQVVEKQLGVPATSRSWNTVADICEVLADKAG